MKTIKDTVLAEMDRNIEILNRTIESYQLAVDRLKENRERVMKEE